MAEMTNDFKRLLAAQSYEKQIEQLRMHDKKRGHASTAQDPMTKVLEAAEYTLGRLLRAEDARARDTLQS